MSTPHLIAWRFLWGTAYASIVFVGWAFVLLYFEVRIHVDWLFISWFAMLIAAHYLCKANRLSSIFQHVKWFAIGLLIVVGMAFAFTAVVATLLGTGLVLDPETVKSGYNIGLGVMLLVLAAEFVRALYNSAKIGIARLRAGKVQ